MLKRDREKTPTEIKQGDHNVKKLLHNFPFMSIIILFLPNLFSFILIYKKDITPHRDINAE